MQIDKGDNDGGSIITRTISTLILPKHLQDERMARKLPIRYVFTIMGFCGFTIQYMLRTSLSITIVAMVNNTKVFNKTTNECSDENDNMIPIDNNGTEYLLQTSQSTSGEFDWDEELQGIILSAFFWGYIIPMFISGWLANRYGGKILFMSGLGIDGVLALFLPLAARTHVGLLIACRVAMGLAEGVMVPSFHQMLGAWSPPDERSRMSSFSYAGQPFGIVLVLPLAGLLCEYGLDGGWPTVFYTLGSVALIICCLWYILVYDSPILHPRISRKEKMYIQTSLGATEKKAKLQIIPWKKIFFSTPVWALSVMAFGFSWGHYMLLTQLPNFMKNVLGFDIKTNGLLSSLPYLLYLINSYVCGICGDWIVKKKYLSVSVTRKFFQVLASGVPAVCLLAVTFSGCNTTVIIMWLVLAGGFFGAMYTACGVNHVDLSPNFSGILQGITLTVGNLAGILVPYVIGLIIQGQQTRSTWDLAYYISSTVLLLSTILYVLFGSGEQQAWNQAMTEESLQMSTEKLQKISEV